MGARKTHLPVVHQISKTLGFADDGSVETVGTIPAGAVILRANAIVTTAFDAGTTNTLDIGTAADPNGLATLIALGTVGIIAADELATTNDAAVTADTVVNATVTLTGTAATAGSCVVVVEYITEIG